MESEIIDRNDGHCVWFIWIHLERIWSSGIRLCASDVWHSYVEVKKIRGTITSAMRFLYGITISWMIKTSPDPFLTQKATEECVLVHGSSKYVFQTWLNNVSGVEISSSSVFQYFCRGFVGSPEESELDGWLGYESPIGRSKAGKKKKKKATLFQQSSRWFPFYFHPNLWRWSNLTNIFERGWNDQLGFVDGFFE